MTSHETYISLLDTVLDKAQKIDKWLKVSFWLLLLTTAAGFILIVVLAGVPMNDWIRHTICTSYMAAMIFSIAFLGLCFMRVVSGASRNTLYKKAASKGIIPDNELSNGYHAWMVNDSLVVDSDSWSIQVNVGTSPVVNIGNCDTDFDVSYTLTIGDKSAVVPNHLGEYLIARQFNGRHKPLISIGANEYKNLFCSEKSSK